MKDFWVYTGLRIGLFVVCTAVIMGLWTLIAPPADVLACVVGGALLSMVLSWKLLEHQRERLANTVQERAHRASERFEEMRSKEDVD